MYIYVADSGKRKSAAASFFRSPFEDFEREKNQLNIMSRGLYAEQKRQRVKFADAIFKNKFNQYVKELDASETFQSIDVNAIK